MSTKELSVEDRRAIFDHIFCKIAAHHHHVRLWVDSEIEHSQTISYQSDNVFRDSFMNNVQAWGQTLLNDTWAVCNGEPKKACLILNDLSDTSMRGLGPLPSDEKLAYVLNTILLIHLTSSKRYSSRSRTILSSFLTLDETNVAEILKDPERAKHAAEEHTSTVKSEQVKKNDKLRQVGIGVSAVAGGILVGVTGGLAAPLIGAGVSTVLGILGVGGTVTGIIATGLASSSVVCAALFGAYGAKSSVEMITRHTKDIHDFAFVPVRPVKETLAVRICVTGWLSTPDDVKAPWTVFGGDDTFALQWEMEALEKLSTALHDLIKSHAMKYLRAEIIKRTILSSVMACLAPVAWLKLGQIIDNPWMNARALSIKAGNILGVLLSEHAFGERPITLTGYSLGALVIVEALRYLATLPTEQTADIVQDVFLFGTPAATDAETWTSIRRLASGRVVNGYSNNDYVLAVLSRASEASWHVAGLHPVEVMGVENILCSNVEGHIQWRGAIGRCLKECNAHGIIDEEVKLQINRVEKSLHKELQNENPENGLSEEE